MTIHDDTTSTIQSDRRGRDHMVFGFKFVQFQIIVMN
jgi:hypothetical protein